MSKSRKRNDLYQVLRRVPLLLNPILISTDNRVSVRSRNDRIAISTEHRFVYYRIPKSANSTVLRTLVYYDPTNKEPDFRQYDSGRMKKRFYQRPSHLGIVRSLQAKRGYYSFTVVRNPYSRLLSAYLDKIVNKTKHAAGFIDWIRANSFGFADFVQFLESGGLFSNPHWTPQVSLIPKPSSLSYIGKMESLQADMAHIIPAIYPAVQFDGVESWIPHRSSANEKLLELYDTSLANRVYRLYESDFRAFAYPSRLPEGPTE